MVNLLMNQAKLLPAGQQRSDQVKVDVPSQPGAVKKLSLKSKWNVAKTEALPQHTMSYIDAVVSAIGAFIGFVVLTLCDTYLKPKTWAGVSNPTMGALAMLLFAAPKAPLVKRKNIFGGFAAANVLIVMLYYVMGDHWLTPCVAIGLLIGGSMVLGIVHPPAGAFVVLSVDTDAFLLHGPLYTLYPGMAAATILLLVAMATDQVKAAIDKANQAQAATPAGKASAAKAQASGIVSLWASATNSSKVSPDEQKVAPQAVPKTPATPTP